MADRPSHTQGAHTHTPTQSIVSLAFFPGKGRKDHGNPFQVERNLYLDVG